MCLVNQSEPAILLYHRGRISVIPDKETLAFLDFPESDVEKVTTLELLQRVRHFEFAGQIESMIPKDHSPDERHRINVAHFRVIQDNNHLLKNLRVIKNMWNPSIERFRERYLLVARDVYGAVIKFGWLNLTHTSASLQTATSDFCIGPGLALVNSTEMLGADPRIYLINENEFLLAFSVTLQAHRPTRMVYSRLKFPDANSTNSCASLAPFTMMVPTFQDAGISARAYNNERVFEKYHKNWPFFLRNNSVLWIVSIDPLIVVRTLPQTIHVDDTYGVQSVNTELVSEAAANKHWIKSWGDMRGGSPGRKIGRDRYLFFFHSRQKLSTKAGDFNPTWTYLMGAFIMSAEAPFRMTAISRVPIFHKDLYVGSWDFIKFMDYVVYPMSFVFDDPHVQSAGIDFECGLRCLHRFNITLTFGYNDDKGMIATVNLGELLVSMMHFDESGKPVSVTSNTSTYDSANDVTLLPQHVRRP